MAQGNIIARTQERGLQVSAEEAATFPADPLDVLICQNMLAGCVTPKAIAENIEGATEIGIRHRLLDPVRCAWISQQLSHAISTRLGQVLTSVYGRAVITGDPQAAKLLLQQYGQLLQPVQKHEHSHLHADLSKVPAEILERMVADKLRTLGLQKQEVKDAEFEDAPNADSDTEVPPA